ncbi:MAG: hypothetical protein QMC93_01135 [Patescibacteria group bacterium]|nr:hypothetical protein [Patescibacteria group bacterium]
MNHGNKGQSLIGIIVVLVIVGLISGGLYLYLSKQVPEIPEIPEKPAEKVIKSEEVTPPPEEELPKEEIVAEEIPSEEKVEEKPAVQKCADGTIYNQCSTNKPKYCDGGNLIDKCSACGCSANQVCQTDGSCKIVVQKLLLLVEDALYGELTQELSTYRNDVKRELGFETILKTFPSSVSISEIKSYVIDVYNNNHLTGVLIVGNLPTAVFINVGFGASAVYSDRIYQDVDNKCDYLLNTPWNIGGTQGVGVFDAITCGRNEKFWIARLTPNSSTESSLSLLKNYFDRNHSFRTGGYSYQPNLLLYAPQYLELGVAGEEEVFAAGEWEMGFFPEMYKGNNYKVIDIHSANPDQNYLDEIKKPNRYEAVVVEAHGLPTYHQLDIRPDKISDSSFFLMTLGSCSVGDFKQKDYIAGKYLFAGNGLLVVAATQPTLGRLNVVEGYYPLTKGKAFFEALIAIDGLYNGIFVFGDPTLKMQYYYNTPKSYQPTDPQIKVSIENTPLKFSKQRSSFLVKVLNNGGSHLKFYFPNSKFTYTPKNFNIGHGSGIEGTERQYRIGSGNVMDILAPGKTAEITFYLYFDKNTPTGDVEGVLSFYSNDPVNPLLIVPFNFSVK